MPKTAEQMIKDFVDREWRAQQEPGRRNDITYTTEQLEVVLARFAVETILATTSTVLTTSVGRVSL